MKPKIRFKGFDGEWNKVLVGNLGKTYSGLSGKCKDDFGFGNAHYITFLNVLTNAHIDTSILEHVDVKDGEGQNAVKKGDLFFNTSSETPEEVGMCAVLDEDVENVYLNSFCFGFRMTHEKMCSAFFAYLMRSNIGRHIMSILAQGATRYNLSKASFCNTELLLPTDLEEQQTIASFLSSFDRQICLQTQRLEKLKQIKAASLQAMFPQEGETMPKVRFKGFKGEWDKVKLSECLEISTTRNLNNEYGVNEVLSVSDEEGVMNQIKLLGRSYAGKSVTNYKILRTNQVVYTKSPLKAKPYGIVKVNKGETGIVSVLYAVYDAKECVSPDYIHYYFEPTFRINNYLLPLINKGAKNTMNISDEVSLQGDIILPNTLEEQVRIVEFLQSLDRQITLHTQRLEKLKQIKAACLDKMFV